MEVILKEDVNKLGARGDVVKVAEGYGRNYLLPRKLAIQANEGNKAVVAQMKAASVRRSWPSSSRGFRRRSSGVRESTINCSGRSLRAILRKRSRRRESIWTVGRFSCTNR
jgi:hypothetical protein